MLAHLKRGAVYQAQGELDAALRDLRRATELDPSALRPLESLGDVNVGLGRGDRAVERYETFIALDDRNAARALQARTRPLSGWPAPEAPPSRWSRPSRSTRRWPRRITCSASSSAISISCPAARTSLEEAARRSPPVRRGARSAGRGLRSTATTRGRSISSRRWRRSIRRVADRLVAVGLAQARAGRDDAAVITLSRAVERFPDAPQVYAALGHVWLDDGAAPRRSRRAEEGRRGA